MSPPHRYSCLQFSHWPHCRGITSLDRVSTFPHSIWPCLVKMAFHSPEVTPPILVTRSPGGIGMGKQNLPVTADISTLFSSLSAVSVSQAEMNSLYPFSTFVALVDDRDRHLSFLDHYRGDDACAGLKGCPVLYVGRLSLYFSFSPVHIFEHFDSFCLLVFLVPVVRYGTEYLFVSCRELFYSIICGIDRFFAPYVLYELAFFPPCFDNSFPSPFHSLFFSRSY